MGWETTNALGGWPLVCSRRWMIPPSPATHIRSSGLSCLKVEAATIRDTIFRSAKAQPHPPLWISIQNWCRFTVPPRPRTRPPIQQGAPSSYFLALAISRGSTTDVQDKGCCWLGGVCLLTGQVGGLAATTTQPGEGHSQAHFTPFQSYSSNTSPLSGTVLLKQSSGRCGPSSLSHRPPSQGARLPFRSLGLPISLGAKGCRLSASAYIHIHPHKSSTSLQANFAALRAVCRLRHAARVLHSHLLTSSPHQHQSAPSITVHHSLSQPDSSCPALAIF